MRPNLNGYCHYIHLKFMTAISHSIVLFHYSPIVTNESKSLRHNTTILKDMYLKYNVVTFKLL